MTITTINWVPLPELPEAKKGAMKYVLVAMGKGRRAFGAFYLNEYPLHYGDDCPDATKLNNWACCKSCVDGDGHPSSGWFEEKANMSDENFYFKMESPIAWAEPPTYGECA
jgi:hypothetical protein